MVFDGRLRIVEPGTREEIIARVRHCLSQRCEVMFAYIHGSFVAGGPFRDLDVAVYIDEEVLSQGRFGSPLAYELDLEVYLEESIAVAGVRIPVDARILNKAPLSFRYSVIKGGVVVFVRDEDLLTDYEVRTLAHYFDFAPFRRGYLEEVLKLEVR